MIRWKQQVVRISAMTACFAALVPASMRAQGLPVVVNTATVAYVDGGTGQPASFPSLPVQTLVQSAPSGPPEIHFFQDATFTSMVGSTDLGSPLFIEAEASACNQNPLVVETINVIVTSTRTGDLETYVATETSANSGAFRILPNVPTRSASDFLVVQGNGFLETDTNDSITAEITDCGGARATATVLIDPGGIVFDSRTNLPVGGARVTLIDATTGLPAQVFQLDGVTSAPNSVVTLADGMYVFPLVRPGTYRLQIVPPPGYTAPSQVPASQLPPSRSIDRNGSFGNNFQVNLVTGAVLIDIPVDKVTDAGTGLFVQKEASRQTVEIGDLLDYSVRVKNVTGGLLSAVVVHDILPFGFAYLTGSARLDGARITDPTGGAGPGLDFDIGAVADQATVTLTYRVRVGPGALQGTGINRATAASTAPAVTSNVASAKVELRSGVFTDKGIIIGKVFADLNGNRVQDDGEPGIPGVRLFLEDGSYVITDSEGKYNFYGISARDHVLKVDETTLPVGAQLEVLNTRNARYAATQFVDLKRGELHKANFAIRPPSQDVLDQIKARRAKAEEGAVEIESNLREDLDREIVPDAVSDPRSLPASGVLGVGTRQYRGGDTSQLGENYQSVITEAPRIEAPVTSPGRYTNVLPEGTLNSGNSVLPSQSPVVNIPAVGLEQAVQGSAESGFGFVDLKDNDTLPAPQTTVRVQGVMGATFSLFVNGAEVPFNRIGTRATIADRKLEAWEFIGVDLRPGENKLEVVQRDAFGNEHGRKAITVIAPDKLGQIKITLPEREVSADGHTPARVMVRLLDSKGVPVSARTALTLEAAIGRWEVDDVDKKTPGTQVFIEGGQAEFDLIAPLDPGDSRIRVSSGMLEGSATLSFLPELRPMLAVGIVEGRINMNKLSRGDIVPTHSGDGFEDELRNFSIGDDNSKTTAVGRAAFYLKGKIKGNYLLTAAYDSEKDTSKTLFRDIQPDEFYPVYGDSSAKGFDAQSTGKLYVRIDNKKCYLLYGDFTTQTNSEVRSLGAYSRSLNGVQQHFENSRVSANAWAAYDSTKQIIEELPANGTSGPYQFRTSNGLRNSEKVEILVRDRNQPSVILKITQMVRFTDYEFEPFTGRILFRAPIPSLDENLNPISIRVTYEVDQGGDKFWVYGVDAQMKVTDRFEVGGSMVREENPLDHFALYSANATFDIGLKTFLIGEFAHSDDEITGSGNAVRVELRHQSDKLTARIFWSRADDHFYNPAALISSGRVEGGAQIAYKISDNVRALIQAVDTESTELGTRRGVQASIEYAFKNKLRLEIGGRYSTETSSPATNTSALTSGVTPNEVRSARIKLSAPLPWVDGGRIFGEYENDLVNTDRRLAAVGGDYQLDAKTRLYARYEFITSLGGPFELNSLQRQNNTIVGVESTYAKDAQFFNEYRARDAFSGRESEAALGLRNSWNLEEGLRLNTSFERISPLTGDGKTDSTAITGALEYTADPDWKATTRLELRGSDTTDSLLSTAGLASKINEDWTFLGKSLVYLVHGKQGTGDSTEARVQVGLAYRDTRTDVWNALGKYEFRIEKDNTLQSFELRRKVHIISLDGNYQPTPDLILSGHYAGKIAFEDSDGLSDIYSAQLVAGRVIYDINSRWDVGLNLSALFDTSGAIYYGIGPEIGCVLYDNLRVAVGYNIFGFSDRDLTAEEYTNPGVYLAVKWKFDESIFRKPSARKEETP
jgi:uncharacterized repeat protein (TIGR01451 family)